MKALLFLSAMLVVQLSFSQSLHELVWSNETVETTPATPVHTTESGCYLTKMIFGWHPFWMNGSESQYDWNLLSDFCYFSYEVDAATGNARTMNGFMSSAAVTTALTKGKKVHLCVSLFENHAQLLENPTARENLCRNLVSTLQDRFAHGINIDFERVPPAQAANYADFIVELGKVLHSANPDYQLSVCLPSVDWSNMLDELTMNTVVDFYTVMGYDYHYSGSPQAGPVDPLYGYSKHFDYSISRTINYYLHAGIPADKLVLGIAYYGREWETTSEQSSAGTTGRAGTSRTYSYIRKNASGNYSDPVRDNRSSSSVYRYQENGKWRQCWLTQADQLMDRYEFVQQQNLKGIGIWTLGADNGYPELWDAIRKKLTTCKEWPQADTLYDNGGPECNYYNNEQIEFTIAPDGAPALEVNFVTFNTEKDFDRLWLYDGPSSNSTLIGVYSGKHGPGKFTTTTGFLTVRFVSDSRSNGTGWTMSYQSVDRAAPALAVAPVKNRSVDRKWVKTDFAASFDASENGFWNAQTYLNNEWKANPATGHVYDEFNIRGLWNATSGTWVIDKGRLIQTDLSHSNTNASLSFPSVKGERFLFQWKGQIGGDGDNRRAGIHIMCEDPESPHRGNSYYVSFRLDGDMIQLYRVSGDLFDLVASFPIDLEANFNYDSKTIYNKSTGLLEIYVNEAYIGSWQDPNPIKRGNGISFRSSNAKFTIDMVAVYLSCHEKEVVHVGGTGHLMACNSEPNLAAGRILNLTMPPSGKSKISTTWVDVDFTAPNVNTPQEEQNDIDTLIDRTQLTLVNLVASDPNSALSTFKVRVENVNGTIVLPEKEVTQSNLFATLSGLVSGENYRIRVFACNGAGLCSDTVSSDGFIYLSTGKEGTLAQQGIRMLPTATSAFLPVEVAQEGELVVYAPNGHRVITKHMNVGVTNIDCAKLDQGIYHVSYGNQLLRFVKE